MHVNFKLGPLSRYEFSPSMLPVPIGNAGIPGPIRGDVSLEFGSTRSLGLLYRP